uniref:Uncharacterized protein n=1 Tax=Solanum tuberosum TaxID=4113 RepID=M0ZKE4_SOLTU
MVRTTHRPTRPSLVVRDFGLTYNAWTTSRGPNDSSWPSPRTHLRSVVRPTGHGWVLVDGTIYARGNASEVVIKEASRNSFVLVPNEPAAPRQLWDPDSSIKNYPEDGDKEGFAVSDIEGTLISSLARKGELVEPDNEPESALRRCRKMANLGRKGELGLGLHENNEGNNQENLNNQEVPLIIPARPVRDVAVPLTTNMASRIRKPPPGG